MYPIPKEAIDIFERSENNGPSDVVAAGIKTVIGGRSCSYRTAKRWRMYWREGRAIPVDREEIADVEEEPEKINAKELNDEMILTVISETIKNPDDLIKAAKIDMSFWEKKEGQVRSFQGQRKFVQKELHFSAGRIESGHVYDRGNSNIVTMFSVFVKLVPRKEKSFEDAIELMIQRIRQEPKAPIIKKVYPRGEHLFVPSVSDMHGGRLSLRIDYTPRRTYEDLVKTTDALIGRAVALVPNIDRILVPIGSDAIHVDNLNSTTTRGTPQQLTAGLRDVIDFVVKGYEYQIEALVQVAPVDVVVVEGNHDRLLCYLLGKIFEERYALHPLRKYITVDSSQKVRKYYPYGTNLIGMEHGDRAKEERLPFLMADEAREYWGNCKYYTWFRGHFHSKKISFVPFDSMGGVSIITLPAFCPQGEWESIMGFYNNKRVAEGYVFHKEYGPALNFPVFVDEL